MSLIFRDLYCILARFYKGVEFGGWISLKTYEHIAKHLHVPCVAIIAS